MPKKKKSTQAGRSFFATQYTVLKSFVLVSMISSICRVNEESLNMEIIDQKKRGFLTRTKPPFLLIDNLEVELFFVSTADKPGKPHKST
jgi:hypothetical protein